MKQIYDKKVLLEDKIKDKQQNLQLRMFAANEKYSNFFSNRSFLIPKDKIRHMKTK